MANIPIGQQARGRTRYFSLNDDEPDEVHYIEGTVQDDGFEDSEFRYLWDNQGGADRVHVTELIDPKTGVSQDDPIHLDQKIHTNEGDPQRIAFRNELKRQKQQTNIDAGRDPDDDSFRPIYDEDEKSLWKCLDMQQKQIRLLVGMFKFLGDKMPR